MAQDRSQSPPRLRRISGLSSYLRNLLCLDARPSSLFPTLSLAVDGYIRTRYCTQPTLCLPGTSRGE
ncbi:uncharacterized protein TrAtP1_007900 [Trichoderma atroviride]|uniref:uncharacterized protein n=1 Tax=Hypocrea atroviridis TaxID=63577 RepID=UPI00332F1AE5|nr:hypothetical protein TrAtP1_007900 [Trichoderma atroviride]